MKANEIKALREMFIEEIQKVKEENLPVLLKGDKKYIENIIFDIDPCEIIYHNRKGYDNDIDTMKNFALPKEILQKIDFSNISMVDVQVADMDFTGLHNVGMDPRLVYLGILVDGVFNGVHFRPEMDENGEAIEEGDDLFELTHITGANFKGSVGAVINPQTLLCDDMKNTVLQDVIIESDNEDPFENIYISGADFTGCKNAVIDPQTIANKDLKGTTITDCIIKSDNEDPFDGVLTDENTDLSERIDNSKQAERERRKLVRSLFSNI